MLTCVGCFGLVVSTCQVIGWKDPSDHLMTPLRGEEITNTKPRWKRLFVCVCFSLGLLILLCVFLGPTQYTSYIYGTI